MSIFSKEAAEQRHARYEEREAARKAKNQERADRAKAEAETRKSAKAEGEAKAAELKATAAEAAASTLQLRPVGRFRPLGLQIMDNGDIHTFNGFGGLGQRLGPAEGAHAEMAAERSRHRVGGAVASTAILGPVGMLGAVGKKAKASTFVILADGTLREKKHDGNLAVTQAQKAVVQFNAAVLRYGNAGEA